jgi:hypothetical protein
MPVAALVSAISGQKKSADYEVIRAAMNFPRLRCSDATIYFPVIIAWAEKASHRIPPPPHQAEPEDAAAEKRQRGRFRDEIGIAAATVDHDTLAAGA